MDRIRIGVDGGGTHCRAALIDASGRRFDRRGGPANVSDFNSALSTVTDLVMALLSEAKHDTAMGVGTALHAGLAGIAGPALEGRVCKALSERMPGLRITVSGDQVTTIIGALGSDDGAVAAIGTGSFLGRQAEGKIRCLGGHGFVLGDQASGAWLGKRLMQMTLLAADGMGAHSALSRSFLAGFNGDRAALIDFAAHARPADFGAFAPRIVEAARGGDPMAESLMRRGAEYITAALHALGSHGSEPLCLSGGLGPTYRDWLPRALAERIRPPRGTALDGALSLAEASHATAIHTDQEDRQ